jgi:hypothetical protein
VLCGPLLSEERSKPFHVEQSYNLKLYEKNMIKGTKARDFFFSFFHGSILYWAKILGLKLFYRTGEVL